ncbi:MAG: type II toxin-antitoxin system RelE/ParE family toxin [bacterium]|nr:type II toxin-antitoxin system RelE/ParE family toxin [bacterium]MDT8396481.1 type II toxin-antitoxin system RelE/ParE family toxin [bacterium]
MPGPEAKFLVRYHPDVKAEDIPALPKAVKNRIRKAIEERLTAAPHDYGQPLRRSLKGYWKLRVGDYRVVYRIKGNSVIILGIMHREKIYEEMEKRGDG